MNRGKFITLEGGEGAGKSTQARFLAQRLEEAGHDTLVTREPGGSALAESIRDFVLSGEASDYGPFAEAILFSVAREDHLDQTIRPALARGAWVICDRFFDSTLAYQGAAGVKPEVLKALERVTVEDIRPDLTIILDIPAEEGLARADKRAASNGAAAALDRFEAQDMSYHIALRQAFLNIAREEPERCVVIDARRPEAGVAEDVWESVVDRLQP